MANRAEYALSLIVNSRLLKRVIIDRHYQDKHPELSDNLVLKLVKQLAGQDFTAVDRKDDFEFFRIEPVILDEKPYRLVFVMQDGEDFLGVITAFRVRKRK